MHVRPLLLAAVIAVTLLAPPAVAQTPLTVVRVGVLGNDDMVSVLYAQRTGLFAKAGLDVQIDKSSQNGSAIAAAVIAGSYDIGKSSAPALIDAHLRGIPFLIVGTAAVYDSKAPYVGFIVAKDSPIQTTKDLVNGIVGVSFIKDGGQLSVIKALEEAGIGIKTTQFAELPMSASAAAVDQKRVLAGEVSYPPLQAALDTGKVRFIPAYNELGNTYAFSVWFTTQDYIAKHASAVKTFVRVQAEAARYTNSHHAETESMLAEFTGIPIETIKKMPRVQNGTGISGPALQPWIDNEAKYGFIARGFPARELIWSEVETK